MKTLHIIDPELRLLLDASQELKTWTSIGITLFTCSRHFLI